MKKVFSGIMALLIILAFANPVLAASGFSLVDGGLSGNYLENASLKSFFSQVKVDAVYSDEQKKYLLTGTAEGTSAPYEYPDGEWAPYMGADTGTGTITGEYDPVTGGFYGKLFYEAKFSGAKEDATLTATVSYVQAEFTGIASRGDASVTLTFMGKDLTPNKDIDFTATFTVQGELPFTQGTEETPPTVTYEPDEPATREDSRMRIKDIASSTAKIYIRRAGSDDTEPADAKTVIYVGDTLIVKKGYGAIVDLNAYDASEFMLRPGTELTIRGKQKVSVFGEALLRLGEHLGKWASEEDYNEEFGIETNRANTSITGTIVVIRDDGEESSLKVIEGTAEFTDKATGDTVRVKAGKMITATEDGPGKIEPFDAEAELSEWEEKFGPLEINKDTAGFPLWAILTIAGGAALVALIAVIAAVSRRRKRRARVQPVIPAAAYPAYAQNVSPSSVRNARTAATGYPPPAQGAPPPLRNLFCSQCGARLNPGALFCSECGSKAD